MNLSFQQQALQQALARVYGLTGHAKTMPILGHVKLFSWGGTRTIYTHATDLQTAIMCPIESLTETAEAFEICLPAFRLKEIVDTLDGVVELDFDTPGALATLKCGAATFKLNTMPGADFPALPDTGGAVAKFCMKAETMKDMLRQTFYASGNNTSKPALNGILLATSEDVLTIVATDGHRMAVSQGTIQPQLKPTESIIPRHTIKELIKALGPGTVEVSVTENHVQFTIENIVFMARLVDAVYPKWQAVMPQAATTNIKVQTEALLKSLRRVGVISREEDYHVKISISAGAMTLEAKQEGNTGKDEVQVEQEGNDLVIHFNAKLIMEALQAMDCEQITWSLGDPVAPSKITGTHTAVIMPRRGE